MGDIVRAAAEGGGRGGSEKGLLGCGSSTAVKGKIDSEFGE